MPQSALFLSRGEAALAPRESATVAQVPLWPLVARIDLRPLTFLSSRGFQAGRFFLPDATVRKCASVMQLGNPTRIQRMNNSSSM